MEDLLSRKEPLAWLRKYRSSSSVLLRTVINTIIHYVGSMPKAAQTHS